SLTQASETSPMRSRTWRNISTLVLIDRRANSRDLSFRTARSASRARVSVVFWLRIVPLISTAVLLGPGIRPPPEGVKRRSRSSPPVHPAQSLRGRAPSNVAPLHTKAGRRARYSALFRRLPASHAPRKSAPGARARRRGPAGARSLFGAARARARSAWYRRA